MLAVSYTRSFLGACCFSVMEWGLGFPTVKLAQALLEYHSYARSPASAGLAWAFLVIANITIFVSGGAACWHETSRRLPLLLSQKRSHL